MDMLAPKGPVYQAGTLSGNPLAMAAGLCMLQHLESNNGVYDELESKSAKLEAGLLQAAKETNIPVVINRVGSMFTMFFTTQQSVASFDDVMKCDTERFSNFFKLSLDAGVYLAPSQFEAGFVSTAHTDEDIEKTIQAAKVAFSKL
jgi:glutamate-1-semialdehyde 2,1-aminomutase